MSNAAEAHLSTVHDDRHAWLDHPIVARRYHERALIDGLRWEDWTAGRLGGAAQRTLEIGCGTGDLSLQLYERGLARRVDGLDASDDHIQRAEDRRGVYRAPGVFRAVDLNAAILKSGTYDLI